MSSGAAPPGARLSSIDGVRGLAIVLVMGVHFLRDDVQIALAIGVDVFFVLSGFLITRLVLAQMEQPGRFAPRTFIRRRFQRIYPALLVLCAVFLVVAPTVLGSSPRIVLAEVVAAVTFTYPVLVATKIDVGLQLLPLWSLSVEAWFYLVWPLALLALWGNRSRSRLVRIALGVLVACLAVQLLRFLTWDGASVLFHRLRVDLLGIGAVWAIFAFLHPGDPPRWVRLLASAGLPSVLIVALLSEPYPYVGAPTVGLLPDAVAQFFGPWGGPGFAFAMWSLGALVLTLFAGSESLSARALRTRPMVWLGVISYSVYLWHYPIAYQVYERGPEFLRWDRNDSIDWVGLGAYALICTVLSLAVGWLSYTFVERRFSLSAPAAAAEPSRPTDRT